MVYHIHLKDSLVNGNRLNEHLLFANNVVLFLLGLFLNGKVGDDGFDVAGLDAFFGANS